MPPRNRNSRQRQRRNRSASSGSSHMTEDVVQRLLPSISEVSARSARAVRRTKKVAHQCDGDENISYYHDEDVLEEDVEKTNAGSITSRAVITVVTVDRAGGVKAAENPHYIRGRELYYESTSSRGLRDLLIGDFLKTQDNYYQRVKQQKPRFDMPSFKEEHILLVVPGSKTTLAQLGLPESFGPPALRVPTRVFVNEEGRYTPNKIRTKKVKVKRSASVAADHAKPVVDKNGGESMNTLPEQSGEGTLQNAVEELSLAIPEAEGDEITQHEEDADEEEGAIYPIIRGKVVNMEALLAVLAHIENLVDAPMHTPVLIVCDPAWSSEHKELITKFYFENKQRPGVTFLLSSLAVLAGYDTTEGCVIDIGYDKTTISSVIGFYPVEECMFYANSIGGQRINEALIQARKSALETGKITGPEFTDAMAEQLKKQPYICEVLQPDVPLPKQAASDSIADINPAANISSSNDGEQAANTVATPISVPHAPVANAQANGDAEENEAEGVLDVASIVASGKASEILAKREQEKSEKAPRGGNKKGAPTEPAKPVRLTNAQKVRVPFRYTERVKASELHAADSRDGGAPLDGERALTVTHNDKDGSYVYANREIEVGLERFAGCDEDDFLVPLCVAIWVSINNAPAEKRQELWNSLAIVGNGSKVKGLKEAVFNHLNENYLIPPNNNTMFTSELPSHFSTPVATGANTPQPTFGQHGAATPTPGAGSSSVNPLLLAATTASQAQNQGSQLAPPGQPYQASLQPVMSNQNSQMGQANSLLSLSHVSLHSPTTIKTLNPKDYYPEWKDHGFEEMAFLGACVMARVIFVLDTNQPANFMTRVQYNEEGPTGIHNYSLA